MLCTLLPPSGGSATVAGVDVAAEPAEVRRRIGVALQEIGLDPVQTGRELLELQCGLYGIRGADVSARTNELLELVGLSDAADRRTKTYSGGMKRRLDLASALVHSPEVLFLDEPTTGLDPASRLTVWDEVRRINASGTTIFLTTQYLEEADQLADRIALLDRGRLVAEGTADELKRLVPGGHVSLRFPDEAHLGRAASALEGARREDEALTLEVPSDGGIRALRALLAELDALDVEVDELSIHTPDLDDVFLALTGRSDQAEVPTR
jgi:ABC-2 type transport system ATP-binding protein